MNSGNVQFCCTNICRRSQEPTHIGGHSTYTARTQHVNSMYTACTEYESNDRGEHEITVRTSVSLPITVTRYQGQDNGAHLCGRFTVIIQFWIRALSCHHSSFFSTHLNLYIRCVWCLLCVKENQTNNQNQKGTRDRPFKLSRVWMGSAVRATWHLATVHTCTWTELSFLDTPSESEIAYGC